MIPPETEVKENLRRLAEAIVRYDAETASALAVELLDLGIEPRRIINEGLSKGIGEVSDKFQKLEVFLPHMIWAADAMQNAVAEIIKRLPKEKKKELVLGKVVLGTVKGDIHDVGKNIFKTMLLAVGFEVYDLGVDVPSDFFISRAEEMNADIIALSCLMTTCLVQLREVIEDLVRLQSRKKYKVLVGGGAVTNEWARKIGADGYAEEATAGVEVAKKVLGKG
jgi:corrinoid protein of di/trimethylamine methyltransferase